MNDHIRIARELNKLLVLEEFGLPRDQHGYSATEPTTCRDKYYQNAFQQVIQNAKEKGVLAGANFWSWGGMARPVPGQIYWKRGDAYLGDPPVEEQGLNSVFDTDTTIPLIRKCNQELKKILK
jgi:mannan endo-1,4-beta-mannosidase